MKVIVEISVREPIGNQFDAWTFNIIRNSVIASCARLRSCTFGGGEASLRV